MDRDWLAARLEAGDSIEAIARGVRKHPSTGVVLGDKAGGRCAACGYSDCLAVLQFHHLDRSTKRFSLGREGVARSLDRARAEAAKCILLCANCHVEVETGFRALPVTSDDDLPSPYPG